MDERLAPFSHGIYHLKDILQIAFGSDHLLGIIRIRPAEPVLVGCVLDDTILLHRVNDARVYADVDTAFLTEVTEYGLILSRGRVLLQRPDTAIKVVPDIHVGVKLHNSRRYHI